MAKSTDSIPPVPEPSPVTPVEPAPTPPVEPTPMPTPPIEPAPAPPGTPTPPAPPAPPTTPYAQPAAPAAPGGPYAQQAYAPAPAGPPQGLSIASMITGIAGALFSLFGWGLLPAIAGIITGHMAQKKQPYAKPFWLTGIITGYVGIGISLIWGVFLLFIFIAAIGSASYFG